MDNEYFVSINEVVKKLSVPAHTLRYWEKQFPTAIRPVTGAAGRRYYRQETIDKLTVIRDLLYKNGLTIAGVKKLLHDGKFPQTPDDFNPTAPKAAAARATKEKNTDTLSDDDIDVMLDLLKSAKQLLNNQ